jgi:peptidoglycan/xylan/chitin deacetylase (PgdA/CDA1 family)
MAEALNPPAAPLVTIVMYHVVRRAADGGVLARMKGLEVADFRAQLTYIRRHYSPIDVLDLPAALTLPDGLPPRPIVLSFDDGYAAHYDVVFPLLADARVPAVFFPVAASLLDRNVLDVNKIQAILASTAEIDRLVQTIDAAIDRERLPLSAAAYREQFWKRSRWDPPEVVYVKRLLQHGLPERVRRTLVDALFASMVTGDERAFADELYMTAAQLRAMRDAGMTIGAHGGRHLRLPTLTRDGQAAEIDLALRVLDAAGAGRTRFAYAYANGEHNNDSIELLRERGCAVAVTTRLDLVRLGADDLLALPRIDTNDLPIDADAGPSEWVRRAGGETAS